MWHHVASKPRAMGMGAHSGRFSTTIENFRRKCWTELEYLLVCRHMSRELRGVLLDVWREAGRHLSIDEYVERVTPLLVERLPFDVLSVRAIDLARTTLEIVAVGVRRAV